MKEPRNQIWMGMHTSKTDLFPVNTPDRPANWPRGEVSCNGQVKPA